MSVIVEFLRQLGPRMLNLTVEHIVLVFTAMIIAVAIALPLGVYLTRCRWPKMVSAIMGVAGVIQTIPSLAMIAFIMVIFSFLRFQTIGKTPAIVALVMYALLPILRNTYTGIRQVDPAVVEVARGMGMTSRQVLFRVELPLSLPVIMAGIRISTVWTIGVACLTTLIGGGGLGDLIMQGLRNIQLNLMLAGTIPAALLAITFDWSLGRLEDWLVPPGLKQESRAQ